MFPTLPQHRADEGDLGAVLRELYRESQQVYGQINGLYTQLDQYAGSTSSSVPVHKPFSN